MNKKVQICPPIKTFDVICRACLKNCDKLYPIKGITFSDSPPNSGIESIVTMSSVFEKYCSVKIHDMDRMPQSMCHRCLELAYNAYDFFEMFRHSQTLLIKVTQSNLNGKKRKICRKLVQENQDNKPKNNSISDSDTFDDTANKKTSGIEAVIKINYTTVTDQQLPKLYVRKIVKNHVFLLEKNPNNVAPTDNEIGKHQEEIQKICNETARLDTSNENPLILLGKNTFDDKSAADIEIREENYVDKYNKFATVIDLIKNKQHKLIENYVKNIERTKRKKPLAEDSHPKTSEHCKFNNFDENKTITDTNAIEDIDDTFSAKRQKTVSNIEFVGATNKDASDATNDTDSVTNVNISKEIFHDHTYCAEVNYKDVPDFNCRLCLVMLKDMGEVMKHTRELHTYLMKCIICDSGLFRSWKLLVFHTASHSADSLLCGKCNLYFTDKNAFDEHNKKYKEIHENPKVCPICKKRCRSRYETVEHMKTHANKKPRARKIFLCHLCGQVKRRPAYHLKVCQKIKKPAKLKPKKVKCSECNRLFPSSKSLRVHMWKHGQKNEFHCKICSILFPDLGAYRKHLKKEHKPRFVCYVCGKAYNVRNSFNQHLNMHKNVKRKIIKRRVECKVCLKTFSSTSYFRDHLNIHLGLQPYVCNICGAKFAAKDNLNSHLRNKTHVGPYECQYCKVTFKGKAFRTVHVKKQHPQYVKEYMQNIESR